MRKQSEQRQSYLCSSGSSCSPFWNRLMAIHPDMLEQTRRFHQAGKLVEAERAYQQILQANGLATNFTITYLYTAVNAIQSITYPNGTETDYAYDPLMNRLTLV